jgi:hypothetical protein
MLKRVVLALVLATIFQTGCVTGSTVTEEDRQGVDVERQILDEQDAELDRLEAAVKEDPKTMAVAAPIVLRMREKNDDARKITKALVKNWGAPEKPRPYSHTEVDGLISSILKSHTTQLGAAFLAGLLFVLGVAKSPAARMLPVVGPILTALESTVGAAEAYIAKKIAGGKVDDAAELQGVLQQAHKVDKVGALMDRVTTKVKEKTGIDAGLVLTPDQAATASPAAVAASTAVMVEAAPILAVSNN